MNTRKIFISHSSKDAEIVNVFVNTILCNGLGLSKQNDIFCTSADGLGIKSGEDFKLRIKCELENASAVIQILSPEYKNSEVCLNEMGAAWILNSKVVPLTVPPIGYDVGFIHANTQQLKIDSKEDLLKLFDDHKGDLFDATINISNYITQIEKFIREVGVVINIKGDKESLFYKENVKLIGTIRGGIFSGPPWDGDNMPNVSFHKYHYIELDKPINVLKSSFYMPDEFDSDCNYFDQRKLHLMGDNDKYSEFDLSSYKDKRVEVIGTFMGGYTMWHQTEVVFRYIFISYL